ncbi:hypothetical protein C8Q73DRAFT_711116 [Cubamyces lactineus]|nr:hypothetical protein C8Q73DRAFT_711116 [Cubamyces lactineus]
MLFNNATCPRALLAPPQALSPPQSAIPAIPSSTLSSASHLLEASLRPHDSHRARTRATRLHSRLVLRSLKPPASTAHTVLAVGRSTSGTSTGTSNTASPPGFSRFSPGISPFALSLRTFRPSSQRVVLPTLRAPSAICIIIQLTDEIISSTYARSRSRSSSTSPLAVARLLPTARRSRTFTTFPPAAFSYLRRRGDTLSCRCLCLASSLPCRTFNSDSASASRARALSQWQMLLPLARGLLHDSVTTLGLYLLVRSLAL